MATQAKNQAFTGSGVKPIKIPLPNARTSFWNKTGGMRSSLEEDAEPRVFIGCETICLERDRIS